MDYEKMYNEALERAKKFDEKYGGGYAGFIFPELSESEDERIIRLLRELGSLDAAKELYGEFNLSYTDVLYWLEKQKESLHIEETCKENEDSFTDEDERMVRKIESFLSAYGADYFSNDEWREIEVWLEKQKEKPTDAKLERVIKASRSVLNNWLDGTDCPDVSGDFTELEYAIREYDGEEKQKEPHYTKRNALFDKCVENCDHKTVKEVSDNVDVLNAAYDYVHENSVAGADFSEEYINKRMEKAFIAGVEWKNEQKEQKPVEVCYGSKGDPDPAGFQMDEIGRLIYRYFRKVLASLGVFAENENLLGSKEETLCYYSQQCAELILKSLRPSWKPSEEQMTMLLAVLNDPNNAGAESCQLALRELYEQLKKL